eukprot:8111073-Pyramimonas_sp.AAC.1
MEEVSGGSFVCEGIGRASQAGASSHGARSSCVQSERVIPMPVTVATFGPLRPGSGGSIRRGPRL